MHAILWDSESCDFNKDKYDTRNALCLWNPACGFRTDLHFANVPNEPIPTYGHSWPPPQCSFTMDYRGSGKKQRNWNLRPICNPTRCISAGRGVVCHRGVSDGSDGACPLWPSHFARTEMFFADGSHLSYRRVLLNELQSLLVMTMLPKSYRVLAWLVFMHYDPSRAIIRNKM